MGAAAVHALAFPGAQPTAHSSLDADGTSPRPTDPAILPEQLGDLRLRLAKRSDVITVNFAPDNTCGYVNGVAASAYTCPPQASCVFIPATGFNPGAAGCCDLKNSLCNFRFACFDQSAVAAGRCDSACQADTQTLKCTSSGFQFCNTIAFNGALTDYFCDAQQFGSALAASTTFKGQTGRALQTVTFDGAAFGGVTLESSSAGRSTRTSTAAASSTAPPPSGGSSTNIGAIVGGAVGGVAVLGLLALGFFLIMRRRRSGSSNGPQSNGNGAASGKPEDASAAARNTTYSPLSPGPTYDANGNPYNADSYYSNKSPQPSPGFESHRPVSEMTVAGQGQQQQHGRMSFLSSTGQPSPDPHVTQFGAQGTGQSYAGMGPPQPTIHEAGGKEIKQVHELA